MNMASVIDMIKEQDIKFVDWRFSDIQGIVHHISTPVSQVDEEFSKMFDGSSLPGFKSIHESDMMLMPVPETAVRDPFASENTLIITCDVVEPTTLLDYQRAPRSIAKRAENWLKSTNIADTCYFGPEPEFFIFDDVRYNSGMHGSYYSIDSHEGIWNSGTSFEGGNMGHRPGVKGGYFPVSPVDSSQDIRSAMCMALERVGMVVEAHHHEVATANQNEIAMQYSSLLKKADQLQLFKYIVRNVAHAFGKTVTFMPKPLMGDNGSGMHCHQSLSKNGINLFAGDRYGGLSELALYYIGGIIKHAKALNALTNPSTNSYKRLVPGFEAPVLLAYSCRNRSAAIRIPFVTSPQGRRIEVRFPDPLCNPYLGFAAQLMAGIDGITRKIHPGDAMDKDLYDLPPEELKDIPTVSPTLGCALDALDEDRSFLLEGDVFSDDLIDTYISLKRKEQERVNMTTHPVEFDMYYSS